MTSLLDKVSGACKQPNTARDFVVTGSADPWLQRMRLPKEAAYHRLLDMFIQTLIKDQVIGEVGP